MGLEGGPIKAGEGIGVVTVGESRGLVNLRTGKTVMPLDRERTSFGRWRLAEPYGKGDGRQEGYLVSLGAEAHIALDATVETFVPDTPPADLPAPEVLTSGDGGVEYRRV